MNRALGSLGLAMRSGRVQCGEAVCDRLIKTGEAKLILIDGGISAGSSCPVSMKWGAPVVCFFVKARM